MKATCGIYQIQNLINGKIYVGSAIKIGRRWALHKNDLKSNRHANKYLQRSYNKYSINAFEYKILQVIDNPDLLIQAEQNWINLLDCVSPKGYNLRSNASSNLGYKPSEENKRKMSLRSKGNKFRLGVKASIEERLAKSSAMIGKPNLAARKPNKWPCVDGWKCKCERCKTKRDLEWYSKEARQKWSYANV